MQTSQLQEFIKQLLLELLSITGIIGIFIGVFKNRITDKINNALDKIKASREEDGAVKAGVQAILRHQLYEMYDKWAVGKGYAPIPVKEDFSNMYDKYHALGANGVMDGTKDAFMGLPTQAGDLDDDQAKNSKAN